LITCTIFLPPASGIGFRPKRESTFVLIWNRWFVLGESGREISSSPGKVTKYGGKNHILLAARYSSWTRGQGDRRMDPAKARAAAGGGRNRGNELFT